MNLRRLLPILLFLLVIPVFALAQEKTVDVNDKKDAAKAVAGRQVKPDPARVLQENQQRKRTDMIKSVPITNKTMDAIRMQNKKATMEQMHTINKAIRKSMTIHKRR